MISRKDVEHIARLARIELTDGEKTKFEKELSTILLFIEKLGELDTANVEPMAGGTLERNVMRGDETQDDKLQGKSAELLHQSPDMKDGWVKVKKVFE